MKGTILDDRLKQLMQDLGNAINESLADSDRIAETITKIRSEGYDVFLVLEATIGFNRRDETDQAEAHNENEVGKMRTEPVSGEDQDIPWTSQDEKFLRALKITIDE